MLAEMLASKGRKGDTEVAHLTKGEWTIPPQVIAIMPELEGMIMEAFAKAGVDPEKYRVGGPEDSVNPETGMKEFGWGDADSWGGDDGSFGGGSGTNEGSWGDQGGFSDSLGSDRGGDQGAGRGFAGSPEVGPNHAQQVNSAFSGEQNTYGGGPEEIGGGYVSAFGFSPARYNNPMTTAGNEFGVGFNPGAMMGSLAGNLMGGPLGGMAGSMIGRQMADTRYSFPGYGEKPQQQGPRGPGSDNILARLLMGQ